MSGLALRRFTDALPWLRELPPAVEGSLAVLRMLPQVSILWTIVLTIGVFLKAFLPVAVTVLTGLLVGSIPAAVDGGLSSSAGRLTLTLLVAAGAGYVTERLLETIQQTLATVFGRAMDRHLQERVMWAVSHPHGIAHLEDPTIVDQIRAAQGVGAAGIQAGRALGALVILLPGWLAAIGSALILIPFHWGLSLTMLLVGAFIGYASQKEFVRTANVAEGQTADLRRAEYFRELALTADPAKEIRIWGLLDWLVARFDAEWLQAMTPTWQARRLGRPIVWIMTIVYAGVNLGALGVLAWAATQGNISLAALAVFAGAVLESVPFNIGSPSSTLAYAAASIPPVLALERRLRNQDATGTGTSPPANTPREGIRFSGVTFRYPGQEVDTIGNLDLFIPAGQSLAIVGANGAGKTTLVKLLCRFYEPASGRITVDGLDLSGLDAHGWQQRVAAIFQDFAQYHLPARDNIGLGAPALAGDTNRLEAASRKAGALELIESLSSGWDTVLSRQYTGGTDLSGGEWQRVALARALFAVEGGARLLILDEPTANLDVRAEAALYDRFLDITTGLTTIIISHRFSTVRRADRICVLADGRITEQGTHDELMALDGQYAHMYTLQASRFTDE